MAEASPICEGLLFKLGGGMISRIQERYFVLSANGSMAYFEVDGTKRTQKGTIDIHGAKVVDRGTYMGKLCFTIEGVNMEKGQKEYFLFSDDKKEKWKWYQVLQRRSGRYSAVYDTPESSTASAPSSGFTPTQSSNLSRIRTSPVYERCIVHHPCNQVCADCNAPIPTWAVTAPFGVFVCIDCVGVHRSLWSGKCKEVELDRWSEDELTYMQEKGGNKVTNLDFEYRVPANIRKPNQYTAHLKREAYIVSKYERSEFSVETAAGQEAMSPLDDDTSASDARSAQSVSGAPPRYIGVAFIMLAKVSEFRASSSSVIAVLTNGFQEVRSKSAVKNGADHVWDQPLQIGIDLLQRPLYFTIYDNDKICGTAEFVLANEVAKRQSGKSDSSSDPSAVDGLECSIAVFGKGVPNCPDDVTHPGAPPAVSTCHLSLVATFNRLA